MILRGAVLLPLVLAGCESCRGQPLEELTELTPVLVDASVPDEIHLVSSTAKTPYSPDYPELVLGRVAVRLNGIQVFELEDGGAPPELVEGALVIRPLRDALRELLRGQARGRGGPTLTIAPAPRTPFRLLAQVLSTAARAGFVRVQLAVTDEDERKHAILIEAPPVEPASPAASGDAGAEPLALTVTVTDQGFRLSTGSGELPGAAPGTRELRIPLPESESRCPPEAREGRGGRAPPACAYDLDALRGRLALVKRAHPEERRVIVTAFDRVDWETIVATLDAARGIEGAELFPEAVVVPGESSSRTP